MDNTKGWRKIELRQVRKREDPDHSGTGLCMYALRGRDLSIPIVRAQDSIISNRYNKYRDGQL